MVNEHASKVILRLTDADWYTKLSGTTFVATIQKSTE